MTEAVADRRGPLLPGNRILIGHLGRMRRDPLGTLRDTARLGNVARIDMGPRGHAFLVSHPDGVRRVLLDRYVNYRKQTRGFDTLRAFLGDGLLTAEGDFWRKQRRIVQPAFHHAHLQRFARTMVRATEDLADRWAVRARTGEVFDVAEDMMQVTLRIVGECLFSTDPSARSSRLGPPVQLLLDKFIGRITSPVAFPLRWPLPGHGPVRRAIRTMHQIVDEIVADRRRTGGSERQDLLDLLMTTEDADTGERMSPLQLRNEVLTLLLAGHETTAAALSWAWVALANHEAVDRDLEDELRAAGSPPTGMQDLARFPRVGQVMQETLRLYPPAWIVARNTVETDVIDGVEIPAGSLAILSPWVSHRRSETFDAPERFDPDRFDPAAGPNGGYSKYAYFPFGGGPRVCIGNGFALLEAQIVLATLRRRFRVRVVDGAAIRPLPLLTLRCDPGVPARVEAVA